MRLVQLIVSPLLVGTPFLRLYLIMLGADIADDTTLDSHQIYDGELVHCGHSSQLERASTVSGHALLRGHLVLNHVYVPTAHTVRSFTVVDPSNGVLSVWTGSKMLKSTDERIDIPCMPRSRKSSATIGQYCFAILQCLMLSWYKFACFAVQGSWLFLALKY